jgi:hypothetical protein
VKLEEAVWKEVGRHLQDEMLAKTIIDDARNEGGVLKQKITHLKRRLEGLAGRLAELPPDLSPEPVFELMRKTEAEIKLYEDRAKGLGAMAGKNSLPVELSAYQSLVTRLVGSIPPI